MKQPNFFILGAPKCGTTSLASWLGEHPNIFMCRPKEPRFFDTDLKVPGRPRSVAQYESLFRLARREHQAVGEGSSGYLMSKDAVPAILRYCPSARFIVCLRNPVEMALSVHAHLFRAGMETEGKFERAWALQAHRKRGQCLPPLCHDAQLLQYGNVCTLGRQMERLFGLVPRERVLCILLDDMSNDPGREYLRALALLGVGDDRRRDFPTKNVRRLPRSPLLAQAVYAVRLAKASLFGIHPGTGLGAAFQKCSSRAPESRTVPPQIKAELQAYFKQDIELLGRLLQRDLSHWLT